MARAIALGWFCHAEFRDTIPNFENSSMLSRELPQSNPDALMAAIRALAIGAEGSEDGSNEYGTFYRLGQPRRPRRAIAGRRDGLDLLACRRLVSFRDPETLEEPTPMKPDLYQRVALRRDVTDHWLKSGDVAVLVDRVPHPTGGKPGVVLEVFNAIGESLS